MATNATLDKLLDAVERLSPEEQEELVDVIERRLADRGRRRIAADIRAGRAEFRRRRAKAAGVDYIVREISS